MASLARTWPETREDVHETATATGAPCFAAFRLQVLVARAARARECAVGLFVTSEPRTSTAPGLSRVTGGSAVGEAIARVTDNH